MKWSHKIALSLLLMPSVLLAAGSAPAGLHWKVLKEVTFNSYRNTGTPAEKAEARAVWGNKISKSKKDASFILLTKAETEDYKYTFTMLDRAGGDCMDPPNGDGTATAQPLYATCPMRVIAQNKQTNKTSEKKYPEYCYLAPDGTPGDAAKNHTEFAFDAKHKKAYFRTIMYGKLAKECNRSIQLQ